MMVPFTSLYRKLLSQPSRIVILSKWDMPMTCGRHSTLRVQIQAGIYSEPHRRRNQAGVASMDNPVLRGNVCSRPY